jgi:predicted ribosome quality control (RQC) complex YloA/Tae2 family protein
MADHKEIKLPQSASYSNLPEYKDHVDQILKSYDSPEGVLGELVRQMADAMWWVKTYQKDKDHLIVMKMANCLVDRNDYRIDPSESALQIFESVFKSWSGESISGDEQGALDSVMVSRGHNLTTLRAEAVRKSIKELEVIDRLIERQFKNMRLLMQAYESVRFAPQLLKKMTLEIQQLEQRIEGVNEDQRREVSRQ